MVMLPIQKAIGMERWKDIPGYEGRYRVSDFGHVYSIAKKKVMQPERIWCGYERVGLVRDKHTKHMLVHRLVADAFVMNPDGYTEVNHIDEDKTNNRADNLEWCSRTYNMTYGTIQTRRTEKLVNDPRQSTPVLQIDSEGTVINEFPSLNEASRQTGINVGNICSCCQGKSKTANGYCWKYKGD